MPPDLSSHRHGVTELNLDWQQTNPATVKPDALRDCVHLWTFDLSELAPNTLDAHASAAEITRASRIKDEQKRWLYLGGRIGLRNLLCRYTGLADADLEIGYGERGKPRLQNTPFDGELTFNYTLSGDKVLYAIAVDRELGVDLEKIPRVINASLMAQHKLSAEEQQTWHSVADAEKNNAMLACWTRKEAYGKVTGVGIRFFLNRVSLFTALHQSRFQTDRIGLFEKTVQTGMPTLLEGVQIALPFSGVASLMYQRHSADESPLSVIAANLSI